MKVVYCKLKDCCLKIGSGATPKGGKSVYTDNGVSLIRSQNVYNLNFAYKGLAHINDDAAEKLRGVTVKEKDVLLNITGDSVARTCVVPNDVLPARVNQHVAIIRPKQSLNSLYLNYYLASPAMQGYLLNIASTGASRNAITKAAIEKLVVPVPEIGCQQQIANVLSAYDNLIENNNKRIKILEQMAENLYKEWFVRFRFPGHETTPFENGIPKGWKIEEIKNISTVTDGVHNTIQDTPNSQYLLLSCKNIKDGKLQIGDDERTIDEETFLKLRKRTLLAKGDVLVTSVGTIGDVLLLNQEPSHIEFQRSVAIIKPNKKFVSSSFLYEMLKSMRKEFENAAHGAAQQCLFIGDINRMKICLPPLETCLFFEKKVQKIYDLILTLTNQSDNLIKQRDLLLPRLMSGKLAV